MIRRPPRSTRTDTLFPYTTLFRSNCSAAVKALSDIIVTSSSAETIIGQLPADQKIIFGPDRHLGGYMNRKFGRDMLLWPGVCIVHEAFSETELLKLRTEERRVGKGVFRTGSFRGP